MNPTHSTFRDLTRGGQITLHALRMLGQVIRDTLVFALCLFVLSFMILGCLKVKNVDLYMISQSIEASLKIQLMGEGVKHTLTAPNGRRVTLKAVDFMKSPDRQFYTQRGINCAIRSLWQSLLLAGGIFAGGLIYLKRKGKDSAQSTDLLGQVRLSPKALKKYLENLDRASPFEIAGVPLVSGSEFQHLLLAGTTGTGKSLCMQELMDQVRAKGERAIVYDIDGAFIPHYYRPDKDSLLNPLDARSVSWNIWQECSDKADFESAAHALIPTSLQHDPFWIDAARAVFADAAMTLKTKNQCRNQSLLGPLFAKDLKSLGALLVGTPAEALMSEQNEKTALSIKATLATTCKSLSYLTDEDPLFSIRRWIEHDQKDAWLFIASNSQKIDALKPLISLWLEVASKALLSLDPTQPRRLWLFLDELASLHRVPSLNQALSRGRKYGAAMVASLQDIHQLYTLYGKNEAEVLSSLFNTKVFFRSQEPASAAWMSRVMGTIERLEQKEGFSYGAHAMRDGVSMHQERLKEPLIKETEFLMLPDCEAFLKLAGNYPLTKLTFKIKKRPRLELAFVPLVQPPTTESPSMHKEALPKNETPNAETEHSANTSTGLKWRLKAEYPLKNKVVHRERAC
ncbi:MAG: type IV conjugative transfer system coupling protein TraD [Gammaproteobacteria bacterium]|nr:type IV conjugative transfer system coupling protein TraD [Gammaproteobacteria bacterium]